MAEVQPPCWQCTACGRRVEAPAGLRPDNACPNDIGSGSHALASWAWIPRDATSAEGDIPTGAERPRGPEASEPGTATGGEGPQREEGPAPATGWVRPAPTSFDAWARVAADRFELQHSDTSWTRRREATYRLLLEALDVLRATGAVGGWADCG